MPLWLQITGLMGGLVWPLYQLWLALWAPKLEVRLTRDLFFRCIELGECLFVQSVLIAEHGNVLIKKIEAKLTRTSPEASKMWELEFLKFGEVMVDNKSVESSFCFNSTSPIRFLSKGTPVQAVYLTRAKGYGSEYAKIIKELGEKLLPLKTQAAEATNDSENKKRDEINNEIKQLSIQYADKLFNKIQLESGTYEICMVITYKTISGLGSYFNRQINTPALSFEIEKNARDQIKLTLPAAIHNNAINKIFNSSLSVNYPQYAPVNIEEDIKK